MNEIRNGYTIKKAVISAIIRVLKGGMIISKVNFVHINEFMRIGQGIKKLWNIMQALDRHQIELTNHQPNFHLEKAMWNIISQGINDPVQGHIQDDNHCLILVLILTTINGVAPQQNVSTLAGKRLLGQAMARIDSSVYKVQGNIKILVLEPNTNISSTRKRALNHTISILQSQRLIICNGDTLPHSVINQKISCIQLSSKTVQRSIKWTVAKVESKVALGVLASSNHQQPNTLLAELTHKLIGVKMQTILFGRKTWFCKTVKI